MAKKYIGKEAVDKLMRLFFNDLKGKQDKLSEITAEETRAIWNGLNQESMVDIQVLVLNNRADERTVAGITVKLIDESSGSVVEESISEDIGSELQAVISFMVPIEGSIYTIQVANPEYNSLFAEGIDTSRECEYIRVTFYLENGESEISYISMNAGEELDEEVEGEA